MKTKLLLAALMLSISLSLSAESGTCGDNLTWTLSNGILTISGTGAMKDYIYYSSPWCYNISINTVTIKDGVTSIGVEAFYGCSGLTSITIPNSVTSIGYEAFYDCYSLTSITIPNSVTSIGERAFAYCSSLPIIDGIRYADTYLVEAVDKTLSTYTIKEGTRWIGGSAFENCTSLTSITIPNSVTSIRDEAFYACSGLTSVTIGNSVTSIGLNAFSGCSGLTSVTIPNSVTSIGNFAFEGCRSLTSPVFNAHVFAKMPQSYSGAYTIPDGIESIAGGAFEKCSSLTSVTIPNSVTSIGDKAFYNCSSLTSVTIPNSVTSIGWFAFSGCSSLPIIDDIRYADTYLVEAVDNTLSTYTIKEGTKWIGVSAFYNCSSLTSITIPNSVTTIESDAFRACSSLTSVTIPNSVTSIGELAFYNCSSLTSITCEAVNPPTLGDNAFGYVNKSIPLYVPAQSVDLYKAAYQWQDFTNIQPIGSQSGDVTTPTVTVTTTSADIAWPQISGAASYELVIKDKKGNVVCTLVFDAEGHLTSLNFGAPDRDNIRKQPQAGTFSFTVTGLKENTEYTYTLTAKDSQGKAIDTKTGTFKTSGGTPVDETERDAAPAPRKQMKNGILRILTPNGTAYDLQGHRLD